MSKPQATGAKKYIMGIAGTFAVKNGSEQDRGFFSRPCGTAASRITDSAYLTCKNLCTAGKILSLTSRFLSRDRQLFTRNTYQAFIFASELYRATDEAVPVDL